MKPEELEAVADWIARAGLEHLDEGALLEGLCARLIAGGISIARSIIAIDTLHPVHEGLVFFWSLDEGGTVERISHEESRRSLTAAWLRSPFHHLRHTGRSMMRRRLDGTDPLDFAIFEELRAEGHTDYVAFVHPFGESGSVGELDGLHGSWSTRDPRGFADADIAALARLFPVLALATKAIALQRIVGTLVETYLGRDAGKRVLSGRIERGVTERMRAVLWFSDLRGFTRVTDTAPPDAIIPFLNDYAEAILSAIRDAGGDVLKLIGDGTLAVFRADDPAGACRRALDAAANLEARVGAVTRRRAGAGLPVTEAYLGLHLGEVFFGNIGSSDRLDFTVIGPAVNMASRVSAMCRSAERHVLMSKAFAVAAPPRDDIVSVGRYALRGFDEPQELFTLLRSRDRDG